MNEKIIERAGEIIAERAKGSQNFVTLDVKREMWYNGLKNHFSGYDDPNYCVLKFTTERYNLLIDWQAVQGELL